ncbi:MAG: nucleotide exchange factor GrpE [Candidatus Binatia bacterium]
MTEESKTNQEETGENQLGAESTSVDNVDNPDALAAELANLRQQLAAKEQEAKDNYDRYVRQIAEAENFKKRNARERDDAIRFANEILLKDLLPVIDNLERAIAHGAGGENGKPMVEGVEMVLKGFLDALSKFGVSQIVAVGQPFDPTKHEAIAQVVSDAHEPNAVVEELHKGYMFRDRLLRAALVSVAKPSETKEKKNDIGQVENDPSDD